MFDEQMEASTTDAPDDEAAEAQATTDTGDDVDRHRERRDDAPEAAAATDAERPRRRRGEADLSGGRV